MEEISYVEEVFKHLHTIPENGFKEFKTSKFIKNELIRHGYEVNDGIAGTGIVATLDSNNKGTILGVRADMDSLVFNIDGKEKNIHACGHDAHSAIVLTVAKEIAKKGIDKGKVVFIFQPDEENSNGAKAIIKSGYIDQLEEIVGIHLRPITEAKLGEATPALCHGTSKSVHLKIKGKSAHGAAPHLGTNVIDVAITLIDMLYMIRLNPGIPHSIKATRIFTQGLAYNIIPDELDIVFDVRAQTNSLMDLYIQKINNVVRKGSDALGAESYIKIATDEGGEPAASYDDDMVETAREAIIEVLGNAIAPIVTPGAEDFHFYPQMLKIKSTYIGLGADLTPSLHHPEMTFNLKALQYGKEILMKFIYKRLG